MTYSTKVTSKGQVTIPADIRRIMDIKAGESVHFVVSKNNTVIIDKNNWKSNLKKMHFNAARHLKKHDIKQLTDTQLDAEINSSAKKAVAIKYGPNKKQQKKQ